MAVPLNKAFGYRQEFDPKLRTRLCPVVDNPHITPVVRMDVVIAQFLYVGIRQSRETTEHEDIFDDSRFIIGNLHVHDRLQLRFRQKPAVAILTHYSKSCERVRCDPSVLKGRIAHQLQFLYRIGQCPRQHTPDGRKVDYILFDKFPLQFFKGNILHFIFVLQKRGKASVLLAVVFQRGGFAVFADTVFLEIIQVLIKCLQQELITVPETQPCVLDFLGSDIRIPVADTLVLLADIGLDILQFLIDALGHDALTGCFVGFGVPQFG